MTQTYALRVQIGSHEYDSEFYFVGDGYGTSAEVLDHIAGEHLIRSSNAWCIEEYLLDVLNDGEVVSKEEYDAADTDIECWIHIDVPYQRYSFGEGDRVVEFSRPPTESDITSKVEELHPKLDHPVYGLKW